METRTKSADPGWFNVDQYRNGKGGIPTRSENIAVLLALRGSKGNGEDANKLF